MEEKKIIFLDLKGCKTLGELHEKIRTAFDFPEWYGANLSAFDDLLWSECDADIVLIKGVTSLSKELCDYMKEIQDILEKCRKKREADSKIYEDIKMFEYIIES